VVVVCGGDKVAVVWLEVVEGSLPVPALSFMAPVSVPCVVALAG
jgi:hypothetical protein